MKIRIKLKDKAAGNNILAIGKLFINIYDSADLFKMLLNRT